MDNFELLFESAITQKFNLFCNTIKKLDVSIPISTLNKDGDTILLFCSRLIYLKEYVIVLIDTYGDLLKPELCDKAGNTSLGYCLKNYNIESATKLLNLERTWLTINNIGTLGILIKYVIVSSSRDIFDILINDSRFNINLRDNKGQNAFYIAAYYTANYKNINKYFMEKLLDLDINIDSKTTDNKTSFSYIDSLPEYLVVKMLEKRNKICENANFKTFKPSDFIKISDIGFEKGTFGQIQPVIEVSTRETKILKKFLKFNKNGMIQYDFISELVCINIINSKHNCNIAVDLEGVCLKDNNLYLVLKPLDMRIDEYFRIISKLPEKEKYILSIVESLIKSVYEIHCLGIIHNDLKYANIMINNGKVYIIDFGLSILLYLSPISEIINNYDTSPNIKAPDLYDNNEETKISYNYNDKIYEFKNNRYSYSSDIYSLGVMLLNVILGGDEKYIYIKDDISGTSERIFYIDSDTDETIKEIFPISFEERKKIDDCGDYMYDLITSMIHINSLDRVKLSDLLYGIKPFIKNEITDYCETTNLSELIIPFSSDEIRFKQNECQYLNEIHNNYKNNIINIEKYKIYLDKFINLLNWIFSVMDNVKVNNFDVILNFIINMRNKINSLKSSEIILNAMVIFNFYIGLVNGNYFSPDTCTNICSNYFKEDEFIKCFNEFVLSNPKNHPFFINIQYIIIKLRCLNIDPEVIFEYENYATNMFIKFFTIFANGDINIWYFTISLTHRFVKLNNIIGLELDEINDNYNLDEIESYSFDSKHKELSKYN